MQNTIEQEISLFELLLLLWGRKLFIGVFCFFSGCLAVGVALVLPPLYTAQTKIIPPQSSASAIGGSLALLSSLGGGSSSDPSKLYEGLMRTESVQQPLVARFDLQSAYQAKYMADAVGVLNKNTEIELGKEGIITITVTDKSPKQAAVLANAYVEQLKKVLERVAVTQSAQKRLFYEEQVKKTKQSLVKAELEWAKLQKRNGGVSPEVKVQSTIEAQADLRAKIAAQEIQIQSMQNYATEANPDLRQARATLDALKKQLAEVSAAQGENADFVASRSQLPEISLEAVRIMREYKYQEKMFETLSGQYELARLDEANDSSVLQVIDVATPPEKKSKPKRVLIVVLGFLMGFVLACMWVLLKAMWPQSKQGATHV